MRTANVLERLNLEFKRRTKKIGAFPSEQSLPILVVTIMTDINEEWVTGRKYINLEDNRKMYRIFSKGEISMMKSAAENLKKKSYFFFIMAIILSVIELLLNFTDIFRSLLGNGFNYSFATQQINVYFIIFIAATPITFVASIYIKHVNQVDEIIAPEEAEPTSKKIAKKYALILIAFMSVTTLFDFFSTSFYNYELNQLIFLQIVGMIIIFISYLERSGKIRG